MFIHQGNSSINLLTEENLVKGKFSREIGKKVESCTCAGWWLQGVVFLANFSKKNARTNGHFRPALWRGGRFGCNSPVPAGPAHWQGPRQTAKHLQETDQALWSKSIPVRSFSFCSSSSNFSEGIWRTTWPVFFSVILTTMLEVALSVPIPSWRLPPMESRRS